MKAALPEELLLTAMGQFVFHLNNLQVFYGTTNDALDFSKEHIEKKTLKLTKEHIAKPEVQEIFGAEKCNSILKNEPFYDFFLKSFANRSVRFSKQMVGASTFIFSHTILDDLLTECCRISFEAEPSDWYSLVEERKIEVKHLRKTDAQTLIHEKASELLCGIAKQSMVKRFNLLNRICIPKLNKESPITALVDLNELEIFDQTRHKIIHGQPFADNVSDVVGKIQFTFLVGMSSLMLVGETYKLFTKGNFTKEAVMSKVLSGLQSELPEMKEFFSVLDKITELLKQRNDILKSVLEKQKK